MFEKKEYIKLVKGSYPIPCGGGWLTQDSVYKISDVEGYKTADGVDLVTHLTKTGFAVKCDGKKGSSGVQKATHPELVDKQIEIEKLKADKKEVKDVDEKELKSELREKIKALGGKIVGNPKIEKLEVQLKQLEEFGE